MKRSRHPLERKIRRFRRRLFAIESLRRLFQCLLAAAILFILVVLSQRLFAASLDLAGSTIVLTSAGALAAIVWSLFRRPTVLHTAILADERVKLRERISSALCVLDSNEEMNQALVEDATSRAIPLRVGDVFPYPFFREFGYLMGAGAAAVLLALFLPSMLLIAPPSAVAANTEVKKVAAEEAKKTAEELESLKGELESRTAIKDPLELKKIEKQLEELQKKFEQEKMNANQAVAQLSKMQDKLKEKRDSLGEKMKAMEGVSSSQEAKFTKDVSKQMEMGNFNAAQKSLAELKEKMKSDQLSQQDKQKLAGELQKLAEQLKTANPEMAAALQNAAQAAQSGQPQQAAEAMEMAQAMAGEMGDMMQQMEMLDALENELSARKAALGSASKSGQGQGKGQGKDGELKTTDALNRGWQAGDPTNKGSGMGNAGIGMGGVSTQQANPVNFQKEKLKGDLRKGRILSQFKVKGSQDKGEANEEYKSAYLEFSQAAEDTLNREPLPLEFRSLVQDYFDAIKPEEAAKAKSDAAKSSEATPAP